MRDVHSMLDSHRVIGRHQTGLEIQGSLAELGASRGSALSIAWMVKELLNHDARELQNRQRIEPGVSSAVPTAVAVRGLTS